MESLLIIVGRNSPSSCYRYDFQLQCGSLAIFSGLLGGEGWVLVAMADQEITFSQRFFVKRNVAL